MPRPPIAARRYAPALLSALVALTGVLLPERSPAQSASVGIYTDASGSTCTLSDTAPGLLRAYVVVRTTGGLSAVRFAAPKPACFTATYLADEVPPGFAVLGNSQTGVSVALGGCSVNTTHVLTMIYQAAGTTAPCCEFPVVADPIVGDLQYSDCTFTDRSATPLTAVVNPDGSCGCEDLDFPPTEPVFTSPVDGAGSQSSLVTLEWYAQDPENQPLHFDVFLGDTPSPPQVADSIPDLSFDAGKLQYSTQYYWQVVASDPAGNSTAGPVWTFTTRPPSLPPLVPSNPAPADTATGVHRKLTLTWVGGDPDGDPVRYDLYFGTTPDPPLVQSDIGLPSFKPPTLELATRYYWRIVARDSEGEETTGPVWRFDTVAENPPPTTPVNPNPPDGAVDRSFVSLVLSWTSSDPEGDALVFDVYLGTAADPPLYKAGHAAAQIAVGGFLALTDYYWRIVARDPEGATTAGPVWTFRTKVNQPPTAPSNPIPAVGATISPVNVVLRWTGSSDPDGTTTIYFMALGTSPNPPRSSTGYSGTTFNAGNLVGGSTYYWRVDARDPQGAWTSSPEWHFYTSVVNLPPTTPANPNPPDLAADVVRYPTLSWQTTDPEGKPMNYDVFFGTTPDPPYVTNRGVATYTPLSTLAAGTTYYWKIRARDNGNLTTTGPVWRFTTVDVAQPPTAPAWPFPADNAAGQPLVVTLGWQASDPDGPTLVYDVYFGASEDPPVVASNRTENTFGVQAPGAGVRYYWRVVAKDTDGFEVPGPLWSFVTAVQPPPGDATVGIFADAQASTCSLNDAGAGVRTVYVVVGGTGPFTGARFAAPTPTCFDATFLGADSPYLVLGDPRSGVSVGFGSCVPAPVMAMSISYFSAGNTPGCCDFGALADPTLGYLVVTGCNFEEIPAFSDPLLKISSNGGCPPCAREGAVQIIAAEDTCLVNSPRQWVVDVVVQPGAGGVDDAGIDLVFDPSVVTFVSCERGALTQNWDAFSCTETAGTVSLSGIADAAHDPASQGVFARLVFESHCCSWNAPLFLDLDNASGDFAGLALVDRSVNCRFLPDGDVNNDDAVTVADAQCALDAYLKGPSGPAGDCAGPAYAVRANVDCNALVTPGDAHCIFMHWLDGSCAFCGGDGPLAAAAVGTASRVVLRAIREGNDVVIAVRAEGLATATAFGFDVEYPREFSFVRVETANAAGFGAVQAFAREAGHVRIGAYAGGDPVAVNGRDLVAVRLRAGGEPRGVVTARGFVDELAGVPEASVALDGQAPAIPVAGVVLHQNSPNPFNPRTSIRFDLPQAARVRLAVYGVDGSLVKTLLDESRGSGANSVDWDGTDESGRGAATGIYFCVLEVAGERYQRKMVLLK